MMLPQENKPRTNAGRYRAPRSEAAFVNNIQRPLIKFMHEPGFQCKLLRELTIGKSIVDIVVFLSLEADFPDTQAAFTTLESIVVATLRRNGPTRIDYLEARCGFVRTGLRNGYLKRLIEWDIIEKGKGGQVSLSPRWQRHSKIYAFEAKLTRWSEALHQAESHTRFADRSYVVLPIAYAAPAIRARRVFENHGIGLCVATKRTFRIEVEARENYDHDWRREFALSRLI